MTTIRTTCPRCGEVDMGPDDIVLSVSGETGGIYRFECPGCGNDVEKEADRRIVALLVSAGVHVTPPATGAGGTAGQAPPLTLDDVIAFHEELQDDDAIERFLAGT